ncbi:molybdenum cofactor biosynthesis protein MoaE, partial [Burkholderiaceae bacterium DAT-1]|nr:molybdenum cofactor biosynthesis protein MoaE [Burkholderiaceae bacterium DAT-1]
KALHALAHEACGRFDLSAARIIHRVGTLMPGDRIVLVLAAAAHRHAALQAVDYMMDHLKSTAPFWKREDGPDGSHWVDARQSDADALARWSSQPTES